MECKTFREALSARIDGEAEIVPAEQVDEHLRGCSNCQAWHEQAADLSRALRVREATVVPDLSGEILENVPVPIDIRGWWPRLALGGIAVAQIGLALSQAFGVGPTAEHAQHGHIPVAGHLFNESTAWNLALGIGLFWAAFRPRATSGLIPVVGVFVLVLVAYSTYDLVTGAVPVSRVVGHGLLVAALGMLVVVNRRCGDPAPHGAATVDTDTAEATSAPEVPGSSASSDNPERRPPLRPAGRHRAA